MVREVLSVVSATEDHVPLVLSAHRTSKPASATTPTALTPGTHATVSELAVREERVGAAGWGACSVVVKFARGE